MESCTGFFTHTNIHRLKIDLVQIKERLSYFHKEKISDKFRLYLRSGSVNMILYIIVILRKAHTRDRQHPNGLGFEIVTGLVRPLYVSPCRS